MNKSYIILLNPLLVTCSRFSLNALWPKFKPNLDATCPSFKFNQNAT